MLMLLPDTICYAMQWYNTQVVPLAQLEGETMKWCKRIMQNSPTAIACLKAALNADEDGQAGTMQLAGMLLILHYYVKSSLRYLHLYTYHQMLHCDQNMLTSTGLNVQVRRVNCALDALQRIDSTTVYTEQ
jgi:hypothetical protein